MIRHHLLIAFLFSTSSLAAGNVYAVMPTQGVGAAAEAALVWQHGRVLGSRLTLGRRRGLRPQ